MARIYDYSSFSVKVPTGIVLAEGPVAVMTPYDTLAPEDTIVSSELKQAVQSVETDSFLILPTVIDKEVLETAALCLFNELPDLAITRQESKHQVRFGQLIVQSYLGEERAELSALKPHNTANTVAHEFSLSRYFMGTGQSHGFRTFEPQGMARLASGEYALLSKYEHGVRSLDNVFWNPEHDNNPGLITRAIGKTAYLLGALHAAGWTHGDAQVKNMFVSNYQEVFIADLESMRPFKHKNGRLVEQQIDHSINDDLRTLCKSYNSHRDDLEQPTEEQVDLFSLIYTGIVNNPRSAVPIELRKTSSRLKDIILQ